MALAKAASISVTAAWADACTSVEERVTRAAPRASVSFCRVCRSVTTSDVRLRAAKSASRDVRALSAAVMSGFRVPVTSALWRWARN